MRGAAGQPHLPGAGVAADPAASARWAGLRYVDDRRPGLRRLGAAPRFRYVDAAGAPVRDPATLERIRKLAIPPAWTGVWICPQENGHIQATGRDARGRKQYRYHARWREVRDQSKYGRMIAFGRALPRLRRRVERDLAAPGMTRERVLAAVVRLLDQAHVRIGNAEYARTNRSFGLTTLRNRHARVQGSTVQFRFRGKSGKDVAVDVDDPRVARVVRRCQELPGQELFCYVGDDGAVHDVDSGEVNAYLKEAAGDDFTAKDFRTWAGTILAARSLCEIGPAASATAIKRRIVAAVKDVAERLGNTPAVCRRHYIHPGVLENYEAGTLADAFKARRRGQGLDPDEACLLALLETAGAASSSAAGSRRRPRRPGAPPRRTRRR